MSFPYGHNFIHQCARLQPQCVLAVSLILQFHAVTHLPSGIPPLGTPSCSQHRPIHSPFIQFTCTIWVNTTLDRTIPFLPPPTPLNGPPPITRQQPQPGSNPLLCGCGPWGRTKKRVANHGNWPTLQLLLQCTPPCTNLHRTTPTTPGGTNPSPPFTLRYPPRHPTLTTPCCPTSSALRRSRPSLPNNLRYPTDSTNGGNTIVQEKTPNHITCSIFKFW